MTRYNLPPADDPSSIESFLRVRRSQLPGGRPPIPGHPRGGRTPQRRARRRADRGPAASHARRGVRPRRRRRSGGAEGGPVRLVASARLERKRVDVALGALRDDLNSRVHPPADPAVTAGGGPGGGQVPPQSRPSPAVAQLRSDRLGVMWNVQEARRRGLDPAALWPGQAGLPGRPVLSLPASGGGTRVFRPDQGELEEETWLRRVRPRPVANGGLQEVGGGAGGESQGLHRRRNRQARQARGAAESADYRSRASRAGPGTPCHRPAGAAAGGGPTPARGAPQWLRRSICGASRCSPSRRWVASGPNCSTSGV